MWYLIVAMRCCTNVVRYRSKFVRYRSKFVRYCSKFMQYCTKKCAVPHKRLCGTAEKVVRYCIK